MNKTKNNRLNHICYNNQRYFDKKMESLVIPLLNFNSKLLLTGSSILYLTELSDRVPKDIDLALSEPLTVDEYVQLKDFFKLQTMQDLNYGHMQPGDPEMIDVKIKTPEEVIKQDTIQLTDTLSGLKIDIFNIEYIKDRDTNFMYYQYLEGNNIWFPFIHPSISIGYKARYAFQVNSKSQKKHINDVQTLLTNDIQAKFIYLFNPGRWRNYKEASFGARFKGRIVEDQIPF